MAAWYLPGGPVGPPARWTAMSYVAAGSETEKGDQGPLTREGVISFDKLFAGAPDFLVTPLLMGPVCLISQSRLEEPVDPWSHGVPVYRWYQIIQLGDRGTCMLTTCSLWHTTVQRLGLNPRSPVASRLPLPLCHRATHH